MSTLVPSEISAPVSLREGTPSRTTTPDQLASRSGHTPARLGFLGVGWIGRHRMEAIAKAGAGEVVAVADAIPDIARSALQNVPDAKALTTLDELLELDLDGLIIATPSAMHSAQAARALGRGKAVFCQKPLGRNARETREVIESARLADRLLGVDLSYRLMTGVQRIYELCRSGELGQVYAVEMVFHNAYGPDKPWFYDRTLSGGGCVIDLGIHLVDLALWNLGFPRVLNVTSRLFSQGRPLRTNTNVVEDFAEARLDVETGASVRLACSWKLPAGREAVISGSFYGTKGAAAFHNVDGSFYHFKAERYQGTRTEVLASAPEEWGGCAAVEWARRLSAGARFDPEIEHLNQVVAVLDSIYSNSQP